LIGFNILFVIAVIILVMVFFLIAIRKIGRIELKIWQIMVLGAAAVILTGQISVWDSVRSVNMDVILFLFGVFVIGKALEESGYLGHLSYRMFRRSTSVDRLILTILFGMGLASTVLMNDTLAIIGTPVMLHLAGKHHISPKLLLLTLAISVTTGSVMSPIGNPQNLLIAMDGGIVNPFITFMQYLFIPTLINILAAFVLLKIVFREHFHNIQLNHSEELIRDHHLAGLARMSLYILVILIIVKICLVLCNAGYELKLTYISLLAALPVIILHDERVYVLSRIDWHTLIFFAAMFILMQSVWDTGFFQHRMDSFQINTTPMILAVSVILSQFISNVPLVALYLPMLTGAGASQLMALAAGSTIAGNLTILGAASNVIIIQNAEKYGHTIGFLDFIRIGLPLTLVHMTVYYLFLI
jgi:Na+/H+ antiporter NhaD/arsenite permease-like protein